MPIYEFQCQKCGNVTEVLTTMGDDGKDIVCSNCKTTGLKKLMSVTSTPVHGLPKGGKTCCGRDERCSSPKGGCCGN